MSSKLLSQQDEKEFSKYLVNIKNIIEHLAQIELTLDASQRDSRYSQVFNHNFIFNYRLL